MAWEDHIDPLTELSLHLAVTFPDGGDPEAAAHVVLVQRAQQSHVSALVSISDPEDGLQRPRLLCLVVSYLHLHHDLGRHLRDGY